MGWSIEREAWIDGFRTGLNRRLGCPRANLPAQSWLAGYFEGVDPPERYVILEDDEAIRIARHDGKEEAIPWDVEEGQFDSRDQAELFLEALRQAMRGSPVSHLIVDKD